MALLFQSRLPISFWGECLLTATHLINRFPSKVLNLKSPYEVLFSVPPSYHPLRVFGCLVYACTLTPHRSKLDPRSVPYVFVVYPVGKKGYKLLNLQTMKIFVSRNVKFHGTIFPFISVTGNQTIFPSSSTQPTDCIYKELSSHSDTQNVSSSVPIASSPMIHSTSPSNSSPSSSKIFVLIVDGCQVPLPVCICCKWSCRDCGLTGTLLFGCYHA